MSDTKSTRGRAPQGMPRAVKIMFLIVIVMPAGLLICEAAVRRHQQRGAKRGSASPRTRPIVTPKGNVLEPLKCGSCGGSGRVDCTWCDQTGTTVCLACGGTGTHAHPNGPTTCSLCGGVGLSKCTHCQGTGLRECPECEDGVIPWPRGTGGSSDAPDRPTASP